MSFFSALFPKLVGNEKLLDAAVVEGVVVEGKDGKLKENPFDVVGVVANAGTGTGAGSLAFFDNSKGLKLKLNAEEGKEVEDTAAGAGATGSGAEGGRIVAVAGF